MTKPLTGAELNELVAGLNKLARNLWWSWDQEAQDLFQELSPRGWQNLYHNAVAVLREVSELRTARALAGSRFRGKRARRAARFRRLSERPEHLGPQARAALHKNPVAYFSAEFGFHETLPIAAGGLGILAGDHAKSASDLGLGFVGISLFYREGYFQQAINQNNWQTEYYNAAEPAKSAAGTGAGRQRRAAGVLGGDHHERRCISRSGASMWAHPGLSAGHEPAGERTAFPRPDARVYGGDSTTRIMQEILLGIGGVRLLRALGVEPSVFHMNEGHAAFLTLELIREKMAAGKTVAEALALTQAAMHFHHAHAGGSRARPFHAGTDGLRAAHVTSAQLHDALRRNCWGWAGWTPKNAQEPFCMTVLALKLSRAANGVSELHGAGQPPHVAGRCIRACRKTRCPSATSPTAFICSAG